MITNLLTPSSSTPSGGPSFLSTAMAHKPIKLGPPRLPQQDLHGAALLKITPRKLEAIALLITSISELINSLKGLITSPHTSPQVPPGETTGKNAGTPKSAPSPEPMPTQTLQPKSSTLITPTSMMNMTSNSVGVQSSDFSITTTLNKVTEILTQIQQLLGSLFVHTVGSPPIDENLPYPKVSGSQERNTPSKGIWSSLLGGASDLISKMIPRKELLSNVGSMFSSGLGYLRNIFSSLI